jgi:glc operon protein GlcG
MARLRAVECREFIKVVVEKAEQMGVPISAAVVGPEGNLIALERMDEAGFVTPELAWAKAYTAAAFRSMSPRFQDGLLIQQWCRERNPQLLTNLSVLTNGKVAVSGGCAPVFKGTVMVGAYGVSGATSQQDEEIAVFAREKVGWSIRPDMDTTPPEVKRHINELYEQAGLGHRKL